MTSSDWKSVLPEDMTLEQLAEASTALNGAISNLSGALHNINIAAQRVQLQINQKFNVNLPNVPSPEGIVTYPSEFIANYSFPATEED